MPVDNMEIISNAAFQWHGNILMCEKTTMKEHNNSDKQNWLLKTNHGDDDNASINSTEAAIFFVDISMYYVFSITR